MVRYKDRKWTQVKKQKTKKAFKKPGELLVKTTLLKNDKKLDHKQQNIYLKKGMAL